MLVSRNDHLNNHQQPHLKKRQKLYILPYVKGTSEPIKLILSNFDVKVILKPYQTIAIFFPGTERSDPKRPSSWPRCLFYSMATSVSYLPVPICYAVLSGLPSFLQALCTFLSLLKLGLKVTQLLTQKPIQVWKLPIRQNKLIKTDKLIL